VSAPIARLTQDWVEVHAHLLPSGNEPADQIFAYCAGNISEKVRGQLQGAGMTPDEWAPYLLLLLEIQDGTEALVGVSPQT
jgi:hypothetical protein